jgi:hypothetical protein
MPPEPFIRELILPCSSMSNTQRLGCRACFWLTAGLCVGCFVSGCATVAPWERGTLAKAHMATDATPTQSALRAHVQVSREAAGAEGTAEGGGCGCY